MSRGLGRVERRVLDILAGAAGPLPALAIAGWVLPGALRPTPAIEASVRRSLKTLARKGLVNRAGGEWIHPDVERRADRERAHAARKAEEAARGEEDAAQQRSAAEAEELARARRADPAAARAVLVKTLGMLGSGHAGEVVNAARLADLIRQQLGMSWDELIIAARAAPAPERPQNAPAHRPPQPSSSPYEVSTPLLKLVAAIARWQIASVATLSKSEHGALARFCAAVSKLPPRVLGGYAPLGPVDQATVDKMRDHFVAAPLYMQLRFVALAEECDCRDRLGELIGPLPSPEKSAPRTQAPMF